MKESLIKKQVIDVLKILENQGHGFWINNNSGAVPLANSAGGNRFIRFGRKGSADLIWFGATKTVFIELKTDKGKQSPAQREFALLADRFGYEYLLIQGWDGQIRMDLINLLST